MSSRRRVDAELGAVVHHVAQHHAADDFAAGQCEYHVALPLECPGDGQVIVGRPGEQLSRRCGTRLEFAHQLLCTALR